MATSKELLMPRPTKPGTNDWTKGRGSSLLSSGYSISRSPSVGAGREDLSGMVRSMTPDLKSSIMKSPSHSLPRRNFFGHSVDIGTPNTFRKQMTIETDRIQRQQTEDDLTINQYTVGEVIGQGSFGLVRKAIHENGEEFAMKIVSKRRMRRQSFFTGAPSRRWSMSPQKSDSKVKSADPPSKVGMSSPRSPLANVYREIAILKKLNHPHVVRLEEVLDDPLEDEIILEPGLVAEQAEQQQKTKYADLLTTHHFVPIGIKTTSVFGPEALSFLKELGRCLRAHSVFEYLERGSLMNLPVDKRFSEDECRDYFIDLVLGLEYLHSHKVIHRDIKPSNLLLGNDGRIKISDFGVSEEFEDDDVTLSHTAGTPAFMAPETLDINKRHFKGKASDVWSSGVTLYAMVFGQLPFGSNSITELHEKIRTQEVHCPEGIPISAELEDLLSKLLEKSPEHRITIPEIREHPWLKKSGRALTCKEENCGDSIEVNEQEVKAAVTKSYYPIHVLILIKKMAKQKSFKNPFSRTGSGSRGNSPSPTRTSPVPPSPIAKVASAVEQRRNFAMKQAPTIEISQHDESQ